MTDKELADKVLYRDVFKSVPGTTASFYEIDGLRYTAYKFVRDWRVAGALMERCKAMEIDSIGNPWWFACNVEAGAQPNTYHKAKGESLPRTIIKACCEALSS